MRKYLYLVFIATFIVGCGDNKDIKQNSIKEADISKIEVTQGKQREDIKVSSHEKELQKDKKGFYYSYENKDIDEHETRTRIDAQREVKNRVIDGKVAVLERGTKIDNPYDYVRIDLLKKALSHDFMVKCSACHDDYANGIIGPSLLTKDADYIYNSMMKFKDDPKKNIFMYELVNKMSNQELLDIANEVAEFNKEVRAIKEGKK